MKPEEIAVVVVVLIAGFWLRNWVTVRRRAKKRLKAIRMIVECPKCKTHVGLERYRNSICPSCGIAIAFFESFDSDEFRKDLKRSPCPDCGALNFELMVECVRCGASLKDRA